MSQIRVLKMPSCNQCGRTIIPGEAAVKFNCPNCGDVLIWRCEKCRLFAREYKCPKCGNVGP
ncbi:MAG: zinc finger domain-containing protein [Candidatus Bathyarchaeia archaeon]